MTPQQLVHLLTDLGLSNVSIKGREVNAKCPFHAPDRSPSFNVSSVKPGFPWACWSCSTKGAFLSGLVGRLRQDLHGTEIVKFIRRYGIPTSEFVDKIDPTFSDPKPTEPKLYPISQYEQRQAVAVKDLKPKGFLERTLIAARIGYDQMRRRVMIPYIAYQDKAFGFLGRSSTRKPKYLTIGFERSLHLYEPPRFSFRSFALVEGPLDALRVMEAGYSAVALGGTRMSEAQLRRIVTLEPRSVMILLDADRAGVDGIEDIRRRLSAYTVVSAKILPGGKDPGDFSRHRLAKLLEPFSSMRLA